MARRSRGCRRGALIWRKTRVRSQEAEKQKAPGAFAHGALDLVEGGAKHVLGRPGSDRLSRGLSRSTIGAGGFNGRVRNGIGWNSPAMTTRPAKNVFCDNLEIRLCTDFHPYRSRPSGLISRHGTSY